MLDLCEELGILFGLKGGVGMKRRGIWLLAGIALCLTACHKAVEPITHFSEGSQYATHLTTESPESVWSTAMSSAATWKNTSQSQLQETAAVTRAAPSKASSTGTTAPAKAKSTNTKAPTDSPTPVKTSLCTTSTTSTLVQPTQADPWTYPYDIAVMEAECRTYAESLGWVWKDSLTLTNSSWNGNVSTYPFTKYSDEVIRTLKDSVFEMIALERNSYHGLKTNMRVYFQLHEDSYGDYLIYSLTD